MQLKEFSLISPVIESSHVFKAIETAIPIDVIENTIGNTEVREERKRKLPSSLVVCLVIAMSLWSNDSMASVLKNLVNGLSREWTKLGKYWKVPNSASISEASAALGNLFCKGFKKWAIKIVTNSGFQFLSRQFALWFYNRSFTMHPLWFNCIEPRTFHR